ncbi:MAG: cytoplasmic protein [Archaeoglobi archaeon]|nr:cytoplasmic protein [Candidatus Mnemosynella bozhongmuii]
MKKVAIFTFSGDQMNFFHALLNALDMKERGFDVKIIIEGVSTRFIGKLTDPEDPLFKLYSEVKKEGLIDCVCKSCASQTKSLKRAEEEGLRLCDEMGGHPSMGRYLEEGYEVLLF